MRITKYTTKINRETMRTELVKEKAVNYKVYKKLSNPQLIVNALNDLFDMQNMAEEYIYMLTLNSKSDITGIFEIAHGTIDSCIASPREIFNKALLVGATGLILVHNHPSGYVEASVHDTTLIGIKSMNDNIQKALIKGNVKGRDGKILHCTTHQFRATLATNLISEGVAVKVASELLGQTNPRSINHYVAITQDKVTLKELCDEAGVSKTYFKKHPDMRALADVYMSPSCGCKTRNKDTQETYIQLLKQENKKLTKELEELQKEEKYKEKYEDAQEEIRKLKEQLEKAYEDNLPDFL